MEANVSSHYFSLLVSIIRFTGLNHIKPNEQLLDLPVNKVPCSEGLCIAAIALHSLTSPFKGPYNIIWKERTHKLIQTIDVFAYMDLNVGTIEANIGVESDVQIENTQILFLAPKV